MTTYQYLKHIVDALHLRFFFDSVGNQVYLTISDADKATEEDIRNGEPTFHVQQTEHIGFSLAHYRKEEVSLNRVIATRIDEPRLLSAILKNDYWNRQISSNKI